MTGYRQMRRQARQARRAGMQPMMVISSGDPLPDLVIVIIARWAWRYRSELAPLGGACAVAGFEWYAHAALSQWWPLFLAAAGIAAWELGAFGARFASPHGSNGFTWPWSRSRAGPGTRSPLYWARTPHPCRKHSASALWCCRSRGGTTAGAARKSASS